MAVNKMAGSVDRLTDVKRLASESYNMTSTINNKLFEDREHLLGIKQSVKFLYC